MTWNNIKTIVKSGGSEQLESIIPALTYKYRNWENRFHKTLLTDQEIYFSSAYEFEDEFDCRFPVEFDFSYDGIERRVLLDYETRKYTTLNINQIKSLAGYIYRERFDTDEKRLLRQKEFYELFNHTVGIYCVSYRNNNIHMWNNYANNFNGYCVGTAFYECHAELLNSFIGGGNVNYVDKDFQSLNHVSAFDKNENYAQEKFFMRMIFTKYDGWADEEEFRLFKFFVRDLHEIIPTSERVFKVPKYCFKEIIFGCEMSEQSKHEIIKCCSQENLNVKFSIASPAPNSLVCINEC